MSEQEFWSATEKKDVNMIINAYFDLFSIKGYKPELIDIKRWYRRYKKKLRAEKKEKLKEFLRKKRKSQE